MHDTGIVFLKAKAYVAVGRFNGADLFNPFIFILFSTVIFGALLSLYRLPSLSNIEF
jgi:hypothetical protein